MTKREFFDNLDKQLNKKYKLHPYSIKMIRSLHLGYNKSLPEIFKWSTEKAKRSPRIYFKEISKFLSSCSEETWKDITQKTKFDK